MNLSFSTRLVQHPSLQLQTSNALDMGLDDIHEITEYHKENFYSESFVKDVVNFFITNNKKTFFNNTYSSRNLLRKNKSDLEKAIRFLVKLHGDKFRDSGYSFLAHDLSTGFVPTRLGLSKELIIASLLHDTVENSKKSEKNNVLNHIYKEFKELVACYVYGVSAPDISDAVKKDEELYKKISKFISYGDINPMTIKCFDSVPVNIYDIEHMKAKDGRTAKERQLRFLDTAEQKALRFAKKIDAEGIIPVSYRTVRFSVEEYVKETLEHKRYVVENQ